MRKILAIMIALPLMVSAVVVSQDNVAHAACADLDTSKGRATITKDQDSNLADLASGQYYVWSRVKHADGMPSYIISIDGAGGNPDICGATVSDNDSATTGWEWVVLDQTLSWSGGEVRVQMAGEKDQTGLDCVVLHPSPPSSFKPTKKEDCSPQTDDTEPPSIPPSFAANVSGNSVALSWGASTDDTGIKEYKVYRKQSSDSSFTAITSIDALSYTDNNVEAGQTYEYRVGANDFAGNETLTAIKTVVIENNTGCKAEDVDKDGVVDFFDALSTLANLTIKIGSYNATYDVNNDNTVNGLDVRQIVTNFGENSQCN